ncbi:MAG: DNA-binding protein [Chloroflexi bacterium]|nr:MAG: DNA-binding protein [Chloroflexota bacterium]
MYYDQRMTQQFLTTKEAADFLSKRFNRNIHDYSVARYCQRGYFPNARRVYEPKGPWIIPLEDLENFEPPGPGRPRKKCDDPGRLCETSNNQ